MVPPGSCILVPGVWVDADDDLHIDVGRLLLAAGYPDTGSNRALVISVAVEMFARQYPAVVPLPSRNTTTVGVTDRGRRVTTRWTMRWCAHCRVYWTRHVSRRSWCPKCATLLEARAVPRPEPVRPIYIRPGVVPDFDDADPAQADAPPIRTPT
jgi:hypothetical protein